MDLAGIIAGSKEATNALEAFRYDEYASICYHFTWDKFCDWFLEFAKSAFQSSDDAIIKEIRDVAAFVLDNLLRLLHPVIPFVTEILWAEFGFGKKGNLMIAKWPEEKKIMPSHGEAASAEINWIIRLITEIRTLRAVMNVPPATRLALIIKDADASNLQRVENWMDSIKRMAKIDNVQPLQGEMPKGAAQTVLDEATLILPLEGIIDLEAERARLEKEIKKILDEINKVEKKLSNDNFISRAKPEIVEENRQRLAQFQSEKEKIQDALKHFDQ